MPLLRTVTDQMGRTIQVPTTIRRIVSVVPSQTELLHYFGLEEQVVGITKFCIHPEQWFRQKMRIGGTKQLHLDKIRALKPDIIIANKEENQKEQIEELAQEFPVWISDITTIPQALDMIEVLGDLLDCQEQAKTLIHQLNHDFTQLKNIEHTPPKRVAYFIWRKPWMIAANQTYIHEMLQLGGWKNAFEHLERYPVIELEELKNTPVDLIFLSSEPYPFKEQHIEEIQTILPNIPILLVDGEILSWYGNRMVHALPYFKSLDNLLQNKSNTI